MWGAVLGLEHERERGVNALENSCQCVPEYASVVIHVNELDTQLPTVGSGEAALQVLDRASKSPSRS